MSRFSSRRFRLAVPVAVAGMIGLGAWVPTVAAGSSAPNLQPLSAAQLIAKASQAHIDGLSGTVEWAANLGLPDISGLTGGQGGADSFNWTTLLSGSHQIKVWDAGADQQRLALPSPMAEVDFVRNGNQAWYYDSATDKVTHLVPAPGAGQPADQAKPADPAAEHAADPAVTPDQMAQKLLAHLSPSTDVSVGSPVYVGSNPSHAAYQLVVRPAGPGAAASTISQISVAIDSVTGVPLQVNIDAKGQPSALKVGYSQVTLQAPAAGAFSAPTGSSQTTKTIGGPSDHQTPTDHAHGTGSMPTVSGADWGQVVTFDHANLNAQAQHQLSQVATQVHVASGTAQLVQTNLVNALVLPDGRILAGFVTPAVLEAAAGASH